MESEFSESLSAKAGGREVLAGHHRTPTRSKKCDEIIDLLQQSRSR